MCLVAEKSRGLNMQICNRRALIIQLSEAYRCRRGKGALTPPELEPAMGKAGFFVLARLLCGRGFFMSQPCRMELSEALGKARKCAVIACNMVQHEIDHIAKLATC